MELNSYQLKCIAIITMVIDHVGAVLFPYHMIFRCIGRISFPIFCFLLAEGFYHTKNVPKYIIRLGLFALLSEIPYDLTFRHIYLEFSRQNVFFTLMVGMVLMYMLEKTNSVMVKAVDVLLAMWIAETLRSDYGARGILLIMVYYYFRDNKAMKSALGVGWNFIWTSAVQKYGAFATIPIMMYNGEKGRNLKYVFYAFYPLHLLILYVISVILV